MLPMNRFVSLGFYTPIGTENVRAVGEDVKGDWQKRASEYHGEKGLLLAQRFANWSPYPAKILEFTRRFGPLAGNPYDGHDGFRFSTASWEGSQMAFRGAWKM